MTGIESNNIDGVYEYQFQQEQNLRTEEDAEEYFPLLSINLYSG